MHACRSTLEDPTAEGPAVRARKAYEQGEFLASTDERFRPVYLANAPDGTLYIADMYRGIIEHRISVTEYLRDQILARQLDRPTGFGRIYRVMHETTVRDQARVLTGATAARLADTLRHPNGWWRDTAQRLIVERHAADAVPALTRMAGDTTDGRARLRALWTLDGLDAIQPNTIAAALKDSSRDVRVAAVRIAERWMAEPAHAIHAPLLALQNDADPAVRRQLAASLGFMLPAARDPALTAMLDRHGDDAVVVDAALSSLRGSELTVLRSLLASAEQTAPRDAALTMIAATIVRSSQDAEIQSLFALTGESARPAWQRSALLKGAEIVLLAAAMPGTPARKPAAPAPALPCPTCPGGRAGPGGAYAFTRAQPAAGRAGRGAGPTVRLSREPAPLAALAGQGDDMATRAAAVLARISWPGKPGADSSSRPLTADEQAWFDSGREVYRNVCQGCHQPDGRGQDKVAPALVGSAVALAPADIPLRALLNGKEGETGLMPPVGATLTDAQLADVLTYVRNEWGQSAAPVDRTAVSAARAAAANRKRPWTDDELRKLIVAAGGQD